MTGLPAALVAAIGESPSRLAPGHAEVASSRIQRGDLRFASDLIGGPLDPRLVLVLSVDSHLEFADVLLVHTATEMACDIDLVVSSAASAAPYEVVVETDLRAVVWTLQLGPVAGRLDDGVLSALGRDTSSPDSAAPSGLHRGLKMAGPSDPRWRFKQDEGTMLRALSQDCTEALIDEGSWLVEPGLLQPDLLDLAEDPAALVADLMHWATTRRLDIGLTEIEMLLELGALDFDAWTALDDLGLDAWTTIQTLVERSVTAPRDQSQGPLRVLTATHLQVQERSAEPDVIRYLGQKAHAPA